MAKVMVSLPDDLLSAIDRSARHRGTTRSGLLAEAARRELQRRDPRAMQGAFARMEARGAEFGVPTSEDVRAERDERGDQDVTG
jgi:predicted transcriptional regulator